MQNVIHFLARVKGLNKEGGNLCTLIVWLCMGTSGWLLWTRCGNQWTALLSAI